MTATPTAAHCYPLW